jgi:hypothetical protein
MASRAVDRRGQTVDLPFSSLAERDAEAPKRFSREALPQPHTENPIDRHAVKDSPAPAAGP